MKKILLFLASAVLFSSISLAQNVPDGAGIAAEIRDHEAAEFNSQHPVVQKKIQELYNESQIAFKQKEYYIAISKAKSIKFMLPNGYKDTEKILFDSEFEIASKVQKQKDEAVRAEKVKTDDFMKNLLSICKASLKQGMPKGKMKNCLEQVFNWEPYNEEARLLLKEAKRVEAPM